MDDHYQVRIYEMEMAAATERLEAAQDLKRPSTIFQPRLSIDGDQWCALYGENLQDGVAGFGDSPADAIKAFNEAWVAVLPDRDIWRFGPDGSRKLTPEELVEYRDKLKERGQ